MNKKLLSSNKEKKNIYFKVKSVDQENHIVEGVFSTGVEDRQGEKVIQSGWKTDNYKLNPVVLWAHQHDTFPIAKMVEIGTDSEGNLAGKMQFAVNEYEFAATAFALMVGGYLNAFSAGFINNKYQIDEANNVVMLIENELLEVSVVPVPANQLALAKSKGINIKDLDEKKVETKSPMCRMDDETKNQCVSRKIPEIMADDPSITQEQAIAMAESMCDKACSEKAVEAISKSNNETIRKAIETLNEVLKANTETDNQVGSKVEHAAQAVGQKKVSIKLLNKAVRELLGLKKTL